MRMKIWQKLAIAIVLISTVVVTATFLLSMQSFGKGFLSYINELEKPKIEKVKRRLERDYQRKKSWTFLTLNPEKWGHYVNLPEPRHRGDGRSLAFFEHSMPPRPLDRNHKSEPLRPPSSPFLPPHLAKGIPPPRPRGNDPQLHKMAEREEDEVNKSNGRPKEYFSLLNKDLTLIVGQISNTDPALNHEIKYKGEVIAYLHVEPFIKLTKELDQRFVEQQQQALIKISLFALLLSLLGAWILARYFHKRLIPLTNVAQDYTAHDYSARIQVTQADELGLLAADLNLLGRTLEKNQTARQQWIADISHELRTPLSILGGELEAIEDGIRPLNKQSMQSLSSEVSHLKKLVEDLYQLSLSDLGALQYSWETLDLGDIIKGSTEHFKTRFAECALSVTSTCDHNRPLMVSGDSDRLFQLFSNLFENSCRYTNKGGDIKITAERVNDQVVVRIADSSPGVPEDQLKKMFDRLHRVEKSRNRVTGGAGLGLTIVKTIVEAHNGSIYSQAAELGGLEVVITLPIVKH